MFEDIDAYHVGAISPGVQIKLIDVPEMGIFVSKDQMGEVTFCYISLKIFEC